MKTKTKQDIIWWLGIAVAIAVGTAAGISFAAPAYAGPNASQQISALPDGPIKDAMRELDAEDQRLTDGRYDANTGTLYLYTQDMVEGSDGDISRREVVIEGVRAIDGVDGKDGADGVDGIDGKDGRNGQDHDPRALAAVTAMGSLQMDDPLKGVTTWSFGFGGQGGETGVAAGIRYGFTDDLSGYATLGTSLDGKGTSWGVGVSGRF